MFAALRATRLWSRHAGLKVHPPLDGYAIGDEVVDRIQGGSRWIVDRFVQGRRTQGLLIVLRCADEAGRLRLVSQRSLSESHAFLKVHAAG